MISADPKLIISDKNIYNNLAEYELYVSTDSLTHQKITAEKIYFNKTYLNKTEETFSSDIFISSFQVKEGMEDTVVRWLEKICYLNKGFQIILNNYSCIPEEKIFIRIQNLYAIQQLVNQLKMVDSFITSANCPAPEFNYTPYIIIAEKLIPAIYYLAIKEYSKKLFYASFEVKSLVLLKRNSVHQPFKVINRFAVPQQTLARN
jgi:hypothetical protein